MTDNIVSLSEKTEHKKGLFIDDRFKMTSQMIYNKCKELQDKKQWIENGYRHITWIPVAKVQQDVVEAVELLNKRIDDRINFVDRGEGEIDEFCQFRKWVEEVFGVKKG